MSGHIGFVFDDANQNLTNTYPPPQHPDVYIPYSAPAQPPFVPHFPKYGQCQQSYSPAVPNNQIQPYPSPWDNTYPPNIHSGCNSYENGHLQGDWGPGYNAHQQMTPYEQERMMRNNAELEARGYGNHGNGGGIPGGKLGVVGGAAAAGVGTALAMQLLPKKLKKNKLVKYGLPLAGAGAAGYKLNQMNNFGGQH